MTLGVRSGYKMTWRGIGSSSWSSTHSLPLQMLIFKYLLLATVAVLAAPIPFDSSPSPSSDNVLSGGQLPPGLMGLPPTQPKKHRACSTCQDKHMRCSGAPLPCDNCSKNKELGKHCHILPASSRTRGLGRKCVSLSL